MPDIETPVRVIGGCADILGILLAMESANVLDDGQRRMVEEAEARLQAVYTELADT